MADETAATMLVSGGPDSLIGFWKLQHLRPDLDFDLLQVDLGTEAAPEELAAARRLFGSGLSILSCELGYLETVDALLPGRNLLLILLAAVQGARVIGTVFQQDEQDAPDRSVRFVWQAQDAVTTAIGESVEILNPFLDQDKTEMVEWFLGDDLNRVLTKTGRRVLLEDSWSCYHPLQGRHCGDCPACFRRWIAFRPFGLSTNWVADPKDTETAKKYLLKAQEGHYSAKRNRRILEALK